MIAVIFEVWPDPEQRHNYLTTAASMRPLFENIDGFISVERFESLTEPGKLLSLSIWRDEEAIAQTLGGDVPDAEWRRLLDIVTWPIAVKGASIMLAQEVRRGDEVLVKAEVRVAFISGGRAQPIPKSIRMLMKADVIS